MRPASRCRCSRITMAHKLIKAVQSCWLAVKHPIPGCTAAYFDNGEFAQRHHKPIDGSNPRVRSTYVSIDRYWRLLADRGCVTPLEPRL